MQLQPKVTLFMQSPGWSVTFHVLNRVTSLWERLQTTNCKPHMPSVAQSTDCHGNHMGTEKKKGLAIQWNGCLSYKPHVNVCNKKTNQGIFVLYDLGNTETRSQNVVKTDTENQVKSPPLTYSLQRGFLVTVIIVPSLSSLQFCLSPPRKKSRNCNNWTSVMTKVGQWSQLSVAGRGKRGAVIRRVGSPQVSAMSSTASALTHKQKHCRAVLCGVAAERQHL